MSATGMTRRRVAGAALIALHLAVTVAWTSLEGFRLDPSPAPHIEQAGTTQCPPAHDESHCRLCQVATSLVVAPAPVAAAPVDGGTVGQSRPVVHARTLAPLPRPHQPRAPPVAV